MIARKDRGWKAKVVKKSSSNHHIFHLFPTIWGLTVTLNHVISFMPSSLTMAPHWRISATHHFLTYAKDTERSSGVLWWTNIFLRHLERCMSFFTCMSFGEKKTTFYPLTLTRIFLNQFFVRNVPFLVCICMFLISILEEHVKKDGAWSKFMFCSIQVLKKQQPSFH